MFGPPNFFVDIKAMFDERRGTRLAEREHRELAAGYVTLEEISEAHRSTPLYQSMRNPFARAWRFRWDAFGQSDAREGRTRSRLFGNRNYDRGWFFAMLEMRRRGWENKALADELERISDLFPGGPDSI